MREGKVMRRGASAKHCLDSNGEAWRRISKRGAVAKHGTAKALIDMGRRENVDKREIISGIVTVLTIIDILGLTGSAEQGYLDYGEYAVATVIRLIIMGAALLLGSDIIPRKKKSRRH